MTDATRLDNQLRVHATIWSKTMRLLLTTIILTMLAQPVWAETVYYCETTAFAQVTADNRVLNIRPHRFKMAVSADELKIVGSDPSFLDLTFHKVKFNRDGIGFIAVDYAWGWAWAIAQFNPPQFRLTDLGVSIRSYNAHCEDF